MMAKKVNPRKRPMSQADVDKARQSGITDGVDLAMALFFTVLLDKHGWSPEELQKLWREIEDLSESVRDGYVNLHDLRAVLNDEYGVKI